jgi:hypothetical protein
MCATPERVDAFDLGARDGAVRASLQICVQVVHVLHHVRAVAETLHAFVEAAITHGLDELFLAQGFQAVDERRSDQALLVGAVATVARGLAPRAKALQGLRIDFVAVDDGIELVLRGSVACHAGQGRGDEGKQRERG